MALREDKMGQTWLVPRNVTEFIPEGHICHLVIALVDGLFGWCCLFPKNLPVRT